MIIQETPTLNLQFDKAKNDSDMLSLLKSQGGTFTRGSEVVGSGDSVASYVDALGTLRYAKLGHPRPNFVDGVNQGLLIEEERTNLATHSEDYNNAVWTKIRVSVNATTIASPITDSLGDVVNFQKLVATVDNNSHFISRNFDGAGTRTQSVFVKAAEFNRIRLRWFNGTDGERGLITFDLENGTILSGSTNGTIKHIGNGVYKCSSTATSTVTDGYRLDVVDNTGTITFAGNGTDGILVIASQAESGSFPTSYIPTAGTTVTRGAETALKPTATDIINASEGTLYAECNLRAITRASTFRRVIVLDNGGEANSVYVRVTESNLVQLVVFSGGIAQAVIASSSSIGNTKIVATYKLDEFKLYVNGVLSGTDTSGALPIGLDTIRLGRSNASSVTHFLNDELTKAVLYPKALTEAEALLLSRL